MVVETQSLGEDTGRMGGIRDRIAEGYRAFLCDTRTGRIHAWVRPTSLNWSLEVNDPGLVGVTFKADAEEFEKLDLRAYTQWRRKAIGIVYGETILECGPIWQRSFQDSTQELTVSGSGLWSIFDKRKNLHGNVYKGLTRAQASSIKLSGLSVGGIARELVRISLQDNPQGSMNVVLPPPEAGDQTREYQGFNLEWLGEVLRQLTQEANGPDIRFRPRFQGDDPQRVEWVMEVGTKQKPILASTEDKVWDGTLIETPITTFDTDEDGSMIADRAWIPGSGQEKNMLLATAARTIDDGGPFTEVDEAAKQQEDLSVLEGYARRALAGSAGAETKITPSVRIDAKPKLGTYLPGDFARIVVPNTHKTLPAGERRMRILGFSGEGSSDSVTLNLAPLTGIRAVASANVTRSHNLQEPFPPLWPAADLYPDYLLFPS